MIDPSMSKEIVETLSEKLRLYYVFPDIAEEICKRLQKHLEDGEYDSITGEERLASTLTAHLQEVNHDRHLNVFWLPEPLPEQEGPLNAS